MELGSSLDISRGLDTQMVIDAGPSQNDDEILSMCNVHCVVYLTDTSSYHSFSRHGDADRGR